MGREDEIFNYHDKNVYDNGVLRNKLGLEDGELLDEVERMITTFKLTKLYLENITGNFDKNHLFSIHKYLFSDIYDFAGEQREDVISKRIPFCFPSFIDVNLEETLRKANKDYKTIKNRNDLVKFIANLYCDLDLIHPFREGNGRCEREFIRQYVERIVKEQKLGEYAIDFNLLKNKEELVSAVVIAETRGDLSFLEEVLNSIIVLKSKDNIKKNSKTR